MQKLSTITGSMMPSEQTTEGVSSSKISSSVVPPTQIIKCLFKFQTDNPQLKADKDNPFYKGSKYAPLVDVQIFLQRLTKYHLTYMQSINFETDVPYLSTIIMHEDGHIWVADRTPIRCKDREDPQKFFAGVTYSARNSLLRVFSVASSKDIDMDDDGNDATNLKNNKKIEVKKEVKTLDLNGILNGIIACKSQQQLKDFAQLHIVKSKFDDDVMKKIKTSYSAHLLYLKNNT